MGLARNAVVGGLALACAWTASPVRAAVAPARPRVIVSSDLPPLDVIPGKGARAGDPPEKLSDPDDVQSMVRFLLYANELDVEGLVASAGTFANVARKQNVLDLLEVYARVAANLQRHDPRYPDAERLRAVTWQGRDGAWGTPDFGRDTPTLESILGDGKDSEASDAIIRVVDRPDPRPIWFCAWGGSREVAQAIWKVRKTRGPAELARFLGRLRLYLIGRQDRTTQWLLDSFPGLFVILTRKNYEGMFWNAPGSDPLLADAAWVDAHIRVDRGALGALYPRSGWDPQSPGVQEGDSPSFLHLVSGLRGRNDPEKPEQGGWGGRFVRPDPSCNHWFDDPEGPRSVWRWRADYQREFAERIGWSLPPAPARQRLVVLSDIEADPDDTQSFVRLLLYANSIDVEALVATTSVHQKTRVFPESIRRVIEAYGQVRDNLLRHEPGFPEARELLDRVTQGLPEYGMNGVGEGRDSPGSNRILELLERADERPLWVSVWGGANTLAQALYRLRASRSAEEVDRLVGRLRVYTISDQDDTGIWIRTQFPKLFYIVSPGGYGNGTWTAINSVVEGIDNTTIGNAWLARNIQQKHGPLGAVYPDVAYGMEGDTPAWLALVPNGLQVPDRPDWGGWGGRYVLYRPNHADLDLKGFTGGVPIEPEPRAIWTNAVDTFSPRLPGEYGLAARRQDRTFSDSKVTLWRWRDDFQNDFAARMDWCLASPAEANHPPLPALGHPEAFTVKSGQGFVLDASGSSDPDGDSLSYLWIAYPEAGALSVPFALDGPENLRRKHVVAPQVTKPETIHFILRVTDKGAPPLSRYRRVIVTVVPAG